MRLDIKTFIIIILVVMIFYLFVQIMSGAFCQCSSITCPSETLPLKGFLA